MQINRLEIWVYNFFFLFNLFIYYLFGCVGSQLRHVGSLLQRRLFVAACGILSSCGRGSPEHVGSAAVAHGLSCLAARGILVSRPGIEPASLALECRFLTTGPTGKFRYITFLKELTLRGESGVGGGGGGMNWETGIDMYTLICIKWMTNKNLL